MSEWVSNCLSDSALYLEGQLFNKEDKHEGFPAETADQDSNLAQ
jgi:hypothetical protein